MSKVNEDTRIKYKKKEEKKKHNQKGGEERFLYHQETIEKKVEQ